jgi:uncharacterized protein YjgD (DUF1641 family)
MAAPVASRLFTPANERQDLIRRLEAAPKHIEAILEAYDLLERLHQARILATVNGLLSAGDVVIDRLTDVVSSPQAIGLLRVSLILGDIVTSLDANRVHEVVAQAKSTTPSWFSLVRRLFSSDIRRTLGLSLGLLEAVGNSLKASGGNK